jgi:hypothetical protein
MKFMLFAPRFTSLRRFQNEAKVFQGKFSLQLYGFSLSLMKRKVNEISSLTRFRFQKKRDFHEERNEIDIMQIVLLSEHH